MKNTILAMSTKRGWIADNASTNCVVVGRFRESSDPESTASGIPHGRFNNLSDASTSNARLDQLFGKRTPKLNPESVVVDSLNLSESNRYAYEARNLLEFVDITEADVCLDMPSWPHAVLAPGKLCVYNRVTWIVDLGSIVVDLDRLVPEKVTPFFIHHTDIHLANLTTRFDSPASWNVKRSLIASKEEADDVGFWWKEGSAAVLKSAREFGQTDNADR